MSKANKRKKRLPWRVKLLIVLLVFLLILVVGTFFLVNTMLSKINRPDLTQEYMTASEYDEYTLYDAVHDGPGEQGTDYVVMEPGDIDWEPANQINVSKDIVNILLIGQDRRPGETRQRSDAMILVTFNQETDEITMTSFLRDLYVQIPGCGYNRLNAAYAFGGMELLDETLEENFGVQVDGNLEVDFDGFTDVFDLLGGVDVTITKAEADYLNLNTYGEVHLDGATALSYARIRKLDSDFGRTSRQRAVMTSAYRQLRQLSITELYDLINQVLPMLTTDLTNTQIMTYAVKLLPTAAGGTLTSQHIPVDNAYSYATINGMAVIVPDFEENRAVLYRTLGGE